MSIYTPLGMPPAVANAMARIERSLPQAGEVLVRVGQRVEPEDMIAQAFLSAPPQIINVARALGIPPFRVEGAMIRERGNKVAQGELLARASRLAGRTCVASVGGIIADVDSETGYVTINPDPEQFELRANVRGIVMEVQPYLGVTIETPAAQVYGVWGVGDERSGVLQLLVTDPSEAILPDKIDARSAYSILIGGSTISAVALRRAVQQQVRGVIVGSIDEAELRMFLGWADQPSWQTGSGTWQFPDPQRAGDPGLTLVVTEGFGHRPMSEPVFELLTTLDRQEALIEGATRLRSPQRRPRIVAPFTRSGGAQIEPPRPPIRPGAQVRLVDTEHLGAVGTVRAVSSQPSTLPSGLRVRSIEVLLEDGSTLLVPRTALEVLV